MLFSCHYIELKFSLWFMRKYKLVTLYIRWKTNFCVLRIDKTWRSSFFSWILRMLFFPFCTYTRCTINISKHTKYMKKCFTQKLCRGKQIIPSFDRAIILKKSAKINVEFLSLHFYHSLHRDIFKTLFYINYSSRYKLLKLTCRQY